MHRKSIKRTEYYRQQASACAAAAVTTDIAEIKQAYLELEQGWLCLTPKRKEGLDELPEAQRSDGNAKPSQASQSAIGDGSDKTVALKHRSSL
jgi:hypothetical protein